jgi:hypothetical protein
VLADGVTLRAVLSKPTTGSATDGLLRSDDGVISSGTITDDVYLDLTIPLVLAEADAGDLSYDAAAGSLTSADGDVLSFGPIAVVNNSEQTE